MDHGCIEDLLGSAGLDGALVDGSNAIPAFRSALQACDGLLHEHFDADTSAASLIRLRSLFFDGLLQRAWRRFLPTENAEVALVAAGGYGRNELFPASDIDLMILTGAQPDAPTLEAIQGLITFLWDIGLEVGHSVRSIKQAVAEAKNDITVITNLIESRFLCGDLALFTSMNKACGPKKIWPSRKFFKGKLREQKARYAKYDDTANRLEPNLKESPGGLRDIQTIGWIAKRHFNANTLQELVEHGYLREDEFAELQAGQEYLGRIRIALHFLTGRHEDRLLFDHQRELAQRFGFDGQGNDAIEAFMQQYYRTVMQIQRLNEMLLQHFQEDTLKKSRWKFHRIKKINRRFQSHGAFIETTHAKVFEQNPYALLEIFLILQQQPRLKGVRAATIRQIRDYRDRIDEGFRNDPRARSYFMEILRQPHGITHELRRMNRYGVLAAYLPEFGRIVGRMQYDLFHAYTVDEHTLIVIRNLRRFTVSRFRHEFPVCSDIMAMLPKPELIYIAGLFHDIAKGRGGDHSELGAQDAQDFCHRHGLSDYDTGLVVWLVRNHLLMSKTSQKCDINDTEVVQSFCRQIGDSVHLNYLYVLTVADMRATNPTLWNSWKANLLSELYNASNYLLRHGAESVETLHERLIASRDGARKQLLASGIDEHTLDGLWQQFPQDYFIRHSDHEIIWHSQTLLAADRQSLPVIACQTDEQRGTTSIFVYERDMPNLFAHCVTALDQMGMDILDARILSTNDGYSLDTFVVHDERGKPVKDRRRLDFLGKQLHQLLGTSAGEVVVPRRMPRQLKHFDASAHIDFVTDTKNNRTIMSLTTLDHPGLLSRIGRAFVECNVRVQNARITTIGERVEDVFFISNTDCQPLDEPAETTRLKDAILQQLSKGKAA